MRNAFIRARAALDFLEQHQLDPTPAHFELALAYGGGTDPALTAEIASRIDGGLRLTAETASLLIARHIRADASAAIDRREREVVRQTGELGQLAADTHDLTDAIGRDVGSIVADPGDWPDAAPRFLSRLTEAERDLADMRAEIAALRQRIGGDGDRRRDERLDPMTQSLSQSGAQGILDALGPHDRNYVMVVVSLDDLVGINDRFGRQVGDNVVNALAATLRQVFPGEELIRWSGNEFVVVLRDSALSAARVRTEDALTMIEARRFRLRGSGEWIGVVSASAGIAAGGSDGAPAALQRARANSLVAAQAGGNRLEG